MRILFIAPQPLYEERGSPIAINEELKVLIGLGYQIDVVTYPIGRDISFSGVRLIRIANPLRFKSVPIGFSFKKIFLDVILSIKVVHLICKKHYDCIHGVEEGAGIALLCKILFKVPVIYDMQSSLPEQLREIRYFASVPGRWLALRVESWLLKNADVIFATKGLASRVLSIVPEKPVWEYSFDGLNCDQPYENPNGCFEVPKCPIVVYTGNFSSYQGLKLLIEAAAHVHLKMTNAKFILVGGAESEILHFNNLVKQLKLEGTIHLHPRVSRTEVADILRQAGVLVLPRPRGDNVPLKMYDYIRSGKPIVATNIRAHTSMLTNQSAILVKPNVNALANGLLLGLKGNYRTKNIAKNAMDITQSKPIYSLEETITRTYNYVANINKIKHSNKHIRDSKALDDIVIQPDSQWLASPPNPTNKDVVNSPP